MPIGRRSGNRINVKEALKPRVWQTSDLGYSSEPVWAPGPTWHDHDKKQTKNSDLYQTLLTSIGALYETTRGSTFVETNRNTLAMHGEIAD